MEKVTFLICQVTPATAAGLAEPYLADAQAHRKTLESLTPQGVRNKVMEYKAKAEEMVSALQEQHNAANSAATEALAEKGSPGLINIFIILVGAAL